MVTRPETTEHIVKAYDDEFARLERMFNEICGLAESSLDNSLRAVSRRDEALSEQVRAQDKEIDRLETEIEALVVRMLALRQPVANDLRYIVAMLRMGSDIERIGDYAKNIAKRVPALASLPPSPVQRSVTRLGRVVQTMLKDVFDACLEKDTEKAIAVWQADEEADELYTSIFRELLTYMMEDPRYITAGTHLMFIAKNLERIGDHATNIAETLHYRERGERLDERRLKLDKSAQVVVDYMATQNPTAEATTDPAEGADAETDKE